MLTQSFGDSVATNEADNVTAIEFDPSGNYLATGDRGGRIVVFRGIKTDMKRSQKFSQQVVGKMWTPYFQFQSHECEFDYLKSLEIEEKIGRIKFCKSVTNSLLLLTTNDKTIKLWKVYEKSHYIPTAQDSIASGGALSLPKIVNRTETVSHSYQRRAFQNAHAYNINSISINNDGESFTSADDLRINLWNLEYNDRCFTLCDIKPTSMEDLKEVITSSQFSPLECNIIFYSTSRGAIKVLDTRSSSVCDISQINLEEPEVSTNRNFFTEITNSIADFKVSKDGRYVTTRDYMSVKLWDIHMNSGPVRKFSIQEYLKESMYELYEAESVFDKFGIAESPDNDQFVTGTYDNQFSVIRKSTGEHTQLQLPLPATPLSSARSDMAEQCRFAREIHINCPSEGKPIRADQKVLHCAWHPYENTVAVAGQAGLYLYKL